MDRLMSVKEFIKLRYTPDSAPDRTTIQARLKKGDLPGFKDGGTWMVNISELERREMPSVDDVDEVVDLICSGSKRSRISIAS